MLLRLAVGLLAAGMALVAAPAAPAAEVSMVVDPRESRVTVVGGADAEALTFALDLSGVLRFSDSGGVTAGPGCAQEAPTAIRCDATPPAAAYAVGLHPVRLDAQLGGGDDRVTQIRVPNDEPKSIRPAAGVRSVVAGGRGRDAIDLGAGLGEVRGGPGDDALVGCRVFGGAGDDALVIGFFDDVCTPSAGDPDGGVADGGPGDDRVRGGAGDDRILVSSGEDLIAGGPGVDLLSAKGQAAPVEIRLGRGGVTGVEGVDGGAAADTIIGSAADNYLDGRGGRDMVVGGPGADSLYTGRPSDPGGRLVGGAGRDLMFGSRGRDVMSGGGSTDTLFLEGGPDRVRGGSGKDDVRFAGKRSRVECGAGPDVLAVPAGAVLVDPSCETVAPLVSATRFGATPPPRLVPGGLRVVLGDQGDVIDRPAAVVVLRLPGVGAFRATLGRAKPRAHLFRRLPRARIARLQGSVVTVTVFSRGATANYRIRLNVASRT